MTDFTTASSTANGTATGLWRAEQVRELDRLAIEDHGIAGFTLMKRAAAASFCVLQNYWAGTQRVTVLTGLGNNAGDGFLLADMLRATGSKVRVIALGDLDKLPPDAALAAQQWMHGGEVEPWSGQSLLEDDLVVDALFGTGLSRVVSGDWAEAIEALNRRGGQGVLAIDIPSGLAADQGQPLGVAVRATATATFIGRKMGLYTGQGPSYCGHIHFDDLAVPTAVPAALTPAAELLNSAWLVRVLAPRDVLAHKGSHGQLLVIGGDIGMPGAPVLTVQAALRAGVGRVTLATRPAHAMLAPLAQPEVMASGVADASALAPLLASTEVVAIGPGLGTGSWGEELLQAALACGKPLIIDADGLNLLAKKPPEPADRPRDWVLTPHPGEAARLLGCSVAEIEADRVAAVQAIAARYAAVVVLKGAGSLIAAADAPLRICSAGNPGMAVAGMGDALTGIIAALRAQGHAPAQAAAAGVFVHALAGDAAAAAGGQRGLLPSDLIACIRAQVNP